MRRRAITATLAAAAFLLPAGGAAADISKYPTVQVPPGAASNAMRSKIHSVNRWWRVSRDFVPCNRCMIRPPQSEILWTYYSGQGFFPNWVRASRDVLRNRIRNNEVALVEGADEILRATRVHTLKSGLRVRVIESAYTAPDGQKPPWRDAMGNGLTMTLLIPGIPDEALPGASPWALPIANEYLNAFAVRWPAGGLMEPGQGRGRWYLEYAYKTGADSRVLNGFMQSLVSLDRFSRQAEAMIRYDRAWIAVRDRARDYVDRGVTELVRMLPRYDLGRGVSRYSLTRSGPAPPKYHLYHLQLLARLELMTYLPDESRAVITDFRERWGGEPLKMSLERDSGPTIPVDDPPIP